MKTIFIFISLLCVFSLQSKAQLLYPEVMEKRQSFIVPIENEDSLLYCNFLPRLPYLCLPNSTIKNPSVRYAIQNLQRTCYDDPELQRSIRTLLRYTRNLQVKYAVEYLQWYIQRNISKQLHALENIQTYITADSLRLTDSLAKNEEAYLDTDLQILANYIRSDSNYLWLQKAGRDSVCVQIGSSVDSSFTFWMNNNKMRYYRLWVGNLSGDTIGTWIQVLPKGNCLKIYADKEAYQSSTLERIPPKKDTPIHNPPPKEYFIPAQVETGTLKRRYWTYYSEVEIALSQGTLKNWSSGGENSFSLLSNLRYYWNYNRNKTSWENWMHYRLGFMKNGDEEMRKNEDRFELNSKLGQKAFKHWYYTAQFNMVTQLFNSYEYPEDAERQMVANFMSPGDFTLSLGMDYKPNDNFSLVISPIAGKWTFVRDTVGVDASRYGVTEAGKRFKREAGAQINLSNKMNGLFKIIDWSNELKLFMSYEKKDRYTTIDEEEQRKNLPLTVNWKMTLNFKINYFMSASIYTETVYDESFSRKLQFKENLSLGMKFRF